MRYDLSLSLLDIVRFVYSHSLFPIVSFRYLIFCIWHQPPSRNTVKLWNVTFFVYLWEEKLHLILWGYFKYFLWLKHPCLISTKCLSLRSAFCTEWPSVLDTDAKCDEHFPIKLKTTDYVAVGPSLRNPSARVVCLKVSCYPFFLFFFSFYFDSQFLPDDLWWYLVWLMRIWNDIGDLQRCIITSWHPCDLSWEMLIVRWPQCKESIKSSWDYSAGEFLVHIIYIFYYFKFLSSVFFFRKNVTLVIIIDIFVGIHVDIGYISQ